MVRVPISSSSGSYDAVIGNGLIDEVGGLLRQLAGAKKVSKLFVVTVSPVRRKWGRRLSKTLSSADCQAMWLEMPDGETAKKLATVEKLATQLTESGADRDTLLLAFGGGVVGDVTGLLASLFMRGIEVVQIPTTVLAQVDASIGGKTGVNLKTGKNLLGTFQPPLAVLVDPGVLSTLPEREFRAGLYESVKAGIIAKPEIFDLLEKINVRDLRRDPALLEQVITKSVKQKADVVSSDEREGDLRRILNFGHTIGHALEAESNYRRFLHGEAVAWGIVAETFIARELNLCAPEVAQRITAATLRLGPLPKVVAQGRDILRLLGRDKKTRGGVPHFVLPCEIGKVKIVNDVPEKLVVESVSELRRTSQQVK
jgi:3-dehydroquinate synthase